ncbi:MAG TPA: bifunctional UDP-N-acetylglucosamine diphosphorylase/glucosamine-1-phosphate N-acetyltransferase GlmU [Thermodesulfobacteriota bacterium]|nr:bifunctional UDP-N-acetylglucosamine diphosphorylase/glucosamine-1-phosphate N-acetyltransferase GlmU [Thermodesulfobacteriota bacterium]
MPLPSQSPSQQAPRPVVVVLAAGQGTRMRSSRAKVLHEVAGWPMVRHVLAAVEPLAPARVVVVVGHQADQVKAALAGLPVEFVLQAEQRGTGHALLQARAVLETASGPVLVLYGDVPCVRPATLQRLLDTHCAAGRPLTMATVRLADPTGYGRVVRDDRGEIQRVVEERDATDAERRIDEANPGLYVAEPRFLAAAVARFADAGRPGEAAASVATGEYYLTDLVALAAAAGGVASVEVRDADEVLGVNTRLDLARAEARLRQEIAQRHLAAGVTLVHPEATYIGAEVEIGPDTTVHPYVTLRGRTRIGRGVVVEPGAILTDAEVADGAVIRAYSVVTESEVGPGAQVGPFAHLRPGTRLAADVRVGNFVEVKNAQLGRGTKANHLSYLGDATVGAGVNIGAGTITCNYDGVRKHQTVIEDGAFIGSDSQLVAPVTVGRGAYVASGTTVTDDVPPDALAIARTRQVNKAGWAARRRALAGARAAAGAGRGGHDGEP